MRLNTSMMKTEGGQTKLRPWAENRRKLVGLTIIKCFASAALIMWILQGIEWNDIFAILRSASLPMLGMAFSLSLIGFYVSVHRWLLLLRAQGMDASVGFLLQSFCVGLFFNTLLPSTIGGDAVRVHDSWKAGLNKAGSVAVVFIDRFLGFLSLMIFAFSALLVSTPLIMSMPSLYVWVPFLFVGMLLFLWCVFMPPRQLHDRMTRFSTRFPSKLRSLADTLLETFLAFRGRRAALVKALLLSLLLQAGLVVQHFLIAEALNISMPFYSFFLTIPLITILMMIPVSINGIGIRENAFVFFFSIYGVMKAEAIAIAWMNFTIAISMGVIGGIVYAFRR